MNQPGSHPPDKWQGRLTAVPPFPGKLRALDGAARLTRWLRGNERAVELWPDAPFHVNLNDRIQRQMWMGCYEPHVTRCLAALLRPGDRFLDVGAHIGYHSYFAAGLVGPTGAVHSFEPDPALFERLTRNLSSFRWATAENAAIWDSESTLVFERSFLSAESGWGALTAVRDLSRGEHIRVQTLSLNSWNNRNHLSSLRAIKMDAEGAEMRALLGARAILDEFRPSILIEINATILQQAGFSTLLLLEELSRLGFRTFSLDFARVSPFSALTGQDFADCIALPEEQSEGLLNNLEKHGFQR